MTKFIKREIVCGKQLVRLFVDRQLKSQLRILLLAAWFSNALYSRFNVFIVGACGPDTSRKDQRENSGCSSVVISRENGICVCAVNGTSSIEMKGASAQLYWREFSWRLRARMLHQRGRGTENRSKTSCPWSSDDLFFLPELQNFHLCMGFNAFFDFWRQL